MTDNRPDPRLLVVEGNVAADRARVAAATGCSPGEGYAAVLRNLAPGCTVDLCCPADPDGRLPAPLASYDGVVVTGSALSIHERTPPALRQIDFARAVFAAGVPMFGSCWGLQLATVAAGGAVARNPRGREAPFARAVTLTEAGRDHPMHKGRPPVFDAPAIHGDEVVALPPGAVVTAGNAVSAVQAAEIRHGPGTAWAVQFHPEYGLADVCAVLERYGTRLVDEGLFADEAALARTTEAVRLLAADPNRQDLATALGLGPELLDPLARTREISNWLARQVKPRGA